MYGEIYFHEYCLDRTGEPARISILKRGFEGAATEVGAGPIPFTKTVLGGSEDRVGGVYPTMASVRLLGTADFGMKDLYTADDSEFQVVHTVDGDVDWVGFLVPEDFSEEDHELNRILDLKAMDGLTKLKDLKFVAPNGQNYGVADGQFEKSLLFHLSEGLKKTGLNLELLTLPDRAAVVKSNATARIHAVVTGPMFYDLDFITPYQEGKIYVGASVEYELEGDPAFGGGSVFTGVVTDIDDSDIGDGGGLGVTINPAPPFLNNPYLFTFFTPTAAAGDVLASTTVDTRMWVDPDEEIVTDKSEVVNPYYYYTDGTYDTWYVLDSIALLFDLKITQQQGRWVAESLDKQYLGEDYYRYNSDGVLLGRHPQNEIKVFECETDGNLRLAGGVRSYGKTLKRVTVNYPYRNKVKGDPLINLIMNGTFFLPIKPIGGDPIPGTFTPAYWERQVLKDPIPYYLIREAYPGGIFGNSITISSTHDFNAYNRFKPIEPIRVSRGDTVGLSWEQSLKEYKFGPYDIITYMTLSIEFFGLDGNRYYLVNSRDQPGWTSRRYTSPNPEGQWIRAEEKWTYSEGQWIREGVGKIWHFTSSYAEEHNHTTGGSWTPFSLVNLSIPAAPADGFIEVRFVGASNRATVYDPSYPFQYPDSITWAYAADQALTDGQVTYSAPTERDSNPINWRKGGLDFSVKVANVSASKVISLESGRTVFFTNEGNYFDTLTVTTPLGDEDNPNHLSTLKIDGAVNSLWTDVSGTLGVSSIEMLLAQTLLRRYLLPHFIADGSLLADNLQFLDKLDLYEDGNIYGIRNGDIQVKDSAFDGSLEEYRLNPTPTNGYDAGANSLNVRTGGSGSGSGGGGSTGGFPPPVGSPVGLREVTEVGNTTPLDISVRGLRVSDFIEAPTSPPDPEDVEVGKKYFWIS